MWTGRPCADGPHSAVASPCSRSSLSLLALAPRRTFSRERIVAYLWPEHPSESARRLLSEALYVLRRELGDQVIESSGDQLVLGSRIWCDVDAFRRAMDDGNTEAALALYHGPLLDGWFLREAPEFER